MTDDFSKPYRGVAYFGLWATETADDYCRRAAATLLAGAVEACADEDMREDRDVCAALAYLAREGHEKRVRLFRMALDVPTPAERHQAAQAALDALNRHLGSSFGRTPARF